MDLITGANGFIGHRLLDRSRADGARTRVLVRRDAVKINEIQADYSDITTLTAACSGVDRVFHCAGYAHAFSSRSGEDADRHWRVNFEGTRSLVGAAGEAGVRRFVFLSSVKAMAEPGNVCADEDFPGQPQTVYGQAKRAAEEAVLAAGARYGMHVVNLRLAMVYGSGGRGNLERMARLVRQGCFPPLPETGNHRSLVHVNDVIAAMNLVAADDRAGGRTYIVTGPQAPSGRQLYATMRKVLEMPDSEWAVPRSALQWAAYCGDGMEIITRRRMPFDSEILDRLLSSAWYSSARIERELGWRAEVSLEDGLREMFGC